MAVSLEPLPATLPSTIEESLTRCPRFRILVVGNSGVGKTSLIANIFNINKDDIDIADNRAGTADINREYTSNDNPCFVLHDSLGFEPGTTDNWKTVKDFISRKCKKTLPVKDRLHAIWMCIETPRTGSRITQTADECFMKLASHLNIPVIFVLTKYDLLFNEWYLNATRRLGRNADTSDLRTRAMQDAEKFFDTSIKELQQQSNQFVKSLRREYVAVSTQEKFPNYLKMLENLTKTTRKCLRTDETLVPWAVAQRIDPKQKIYTSINVGFRMYWKDLGRSTVFRGHVLLDCLGRIHMDIIKVWNFRDPQQLLSYGISGINFRMGMLELIQPFIPQPDLEVESSVDEKLPVLEVLSSIFDSLFPLASMALEAVSLTIVAIEFLRKKYQAIPETAACLEAYIVDLTLVLHKLFVTTRQKPLDNELVLETLKWYKENRSEDVHQLIRNGCSSARIALSPQKNKGNIGDLICRQLYTVETE